MKKIFLAGMIGVMSAGSASCSDDVDCSAAECDSASSSGAFDAIYFGLGAGGSFLDGKLDAKADDTDPNLKKAKTNALMGTAVFGTGKTFKKVFYVGVEGILDFSGSKKRDVTLNEAWNIFPKDKKMGEIKERGIVPGIGIRLGYAVRNSWLAYLRPAVVFPKTSVKNEVGTEVFNMSGAVCSVALGVEKSFCGKFSARLEGEYVFDSDKKHNYNDYELKVKRSGFKIRALCAYNVKY